MKVLVLLTFFRQVVERVAALGEEGLLNILFVKIHQLLLDILRKFFFDIFLSCFEFVSQKMFREQAYGTAEYDGCKNNQRK